MSFMDPWSLCKLIPKLLFLTEITDTCNNFNHISTFSYIFLSYFTIIPIWIPNRDASLFNFQYIVISLPRRIQAVPISPCNFFCVLIDRSLTSFETEHPVEECAAGKHGVHAALSFTLPIIHPPAPSTSQPLAVRPVVPGSIPLPRYSTGWKFSGIIRDLRRGECAADPPPARTYFGLYASKMNNGVCRSPSTMT